MSWVNEWTHVCWPTLALPKSPCCIISVGSHYISVWCRHYVSQHTHIYISSHPFKRRFFCFSPYKHPCGHGFHVLEAMIFKREYEEGWHLVVFEWRWMVIFQVGNTLERWSVGNTYFLGGGKKKTLKDSKNFNEFDLVPQSWLIISSSHPIFSWSAAWAAWVKSLPRKRDVILTNCGHIEKSWIHILVGGFKHEFYFP